MLSAGIVGLPNVGKSTLFNALTRTHKAPAQNYPFCTIDPNVGIVTVQTSGYNQDGTVVITFKRTIMVYKRGQAPQIPRLRPGDTSRAKPGAEQ